MPITKMSTSNGTEAMQGVTGATTRSKGNLQTMLSSYEQAQTQTQTQTQTQMGIQRQNSINSNSSSVSHSNPTSDAVCFNGNGSSDISMQLDAIGRERSSTLGSIRDRGLTFGSAMDFDLDLGFGDNTAVPEGGVIEFAVDSTSNQSNGTMDNPMGVARANANGTSGNEAMNIVSANSSNASGIVARNAVSGMVMNLAQAQAQAQAQSLAQYGQGSLQNSLAAASPYHTRSGSIGNAEQALSISSAAAAASISANVPAVNVKNETNSFFSGMFGTNANDKTSTALLGHSPPSTMATSYERRHFGKRMRAGVSRARFWIMNL
jgi:hypothetical protein